MKIKIKHKVKGNVIFSIEADNWKIAVEAAIKAKADLSYADLNSANLSYADLSSANLSYANLSSADLRSANLNSANLNSANLSFANLSFADLSFANLRSANLNSANLSFADLSFADLSFADLRFANLRSANLNSANLSYADLSSANLSSADLSYIKSDLWELLLHAIPEISALKRAITEGKVEGNVYEGECACLCGTIANIRKCDYRKLTGIIPNRFRPAEAFFMNVKKGDTPKTNQVSSKVLKWIEELETLI